MLRIYTVCSIYKNKWETIKPTSLASVLKAKVSLTEIYYMLGNHSDENFKKATNEREIEENGKVGKRV